ncbi:MAG: NYN domain-containing protein [Candidatus Peregrinibacteria bacterium]|nr:NYN domain-containing protein [Candidatus Peregrinibacteria bacterium]
MSETQPQKETIYVFIDSQNLNLSIRDQGWKLDFKKFKKYLSDKFKVKKAYLFIGLVKANQKLYNFLRQSGYSLIFKPTLQSAKNETIKGNIDAELVLHSMIEYANYDKSIIVTGDGDFHCLIKHLKQKNKLCRLIIPNKYKHSSLLREFGEHITFLNKKREMLEQ